MSEIKRILFIDDECDTFKENFNEYFGQQGIDIIYCKTKDEGIQELDSKRHFDFVLLDWFLEDPESSMLSISFLSILNTKLFVPVFIWTHHLENYEQELLNDSIPYPKDLIKGISKEELQSPLLHERIAELYTNCNIVRLSEIYRETIHLKLEQVFFELSELPGISLQTMIKYIVGDNNNIDWSNDLILNFIHRKLLTDNSYIEKIKNFLSMSPESNIIQDGEIRKSFINKIMYYKSIPNRLRCGDIINIKDTNGKSKNAIIINPDCDLANSQTRYIALIELRLLDDAEIGLNSDNKKKIKEFNHSSYYYLPSLQNADIYSDYVALLKSRILLMEKVDNNTAKYPKPSKQLDYTDYYAVGETLAEIEFICSLDDPYKSDFLNHLHSHDLRVGIPDIKKLWLS